MPPGKDQSNPTKKWREAAVAETDDHGADVGQSLPSLLPSLCIL